MMNNSSPCKCDRCGATANSILNTKHRRCSGMVKVSSPRTKHSAKASIRGSWVAK